MSLAFNWPHMTLQQTHRPGLISALWPGCCRSVQAAKRCSAEYYGEQGISYTLTGPTIPAQGHCICQHALFAAAAQDLCVLILYGDVVQLCLAAVGVDL